MPRTHFDTPPDEYDAQRSGHHGRRQIQLFDGEVRDAMTVVEVGSGTGFVLRELGTRHPNVRFIGVDLEENLVTWAIRATDLSNVEYRVADVTDTDLGLTADLVVSSDVIHHFHDHTTAFVAIRLLLRPGGTWIAIEPNVWHPYIVMMVERMKRAGYDEDHFRPWRLDPLLRQAGFAIEGRRYLHAIPSAIANPGRLLQRLELALERFRLLGGSVVYRLTAV